MLMNCLRSLATALLLFASTAWAGADVVLRFSSWVPATHWMIKDHFIPWFAEIERATEGRVKVDLLPRVVGSAASQFDVVRDGLADMSFILPSYTPGRFPLVEIGELPMLGEDTAGMAVAFERVYREHFLALNEFQGVFPIALWNIPAIKPFNNTRAIETVEDIRGLKLRSPNKTITDTLNKFGGIPVSGSSAEALEMLTTGAIDGEFTLADTVVVYQTTNLLKHVTVVPGGMARLVHLVAINQDSWDRIAPADQAAILEVTDGKLGPAVSAGWFSREIEAMRILEEDHGYVVSRPGPEFVEALKAAMQPIEDGWIERAAAKGAQDPAATLELLRSEIGALEDEAQ